MSLTSIIPLPYRWLILVLFAASLVGFGYVKGISHEKAKWEKATAAQLMAKDNAIMARETENSKLMEKQTATNAAITKGKDDEISTLHTRVAALGRMRKPAFCGGPASTANPTRPRGSDAAPSTSGVLSPEMDGRIKALIEEVETATATGRAAQAFIKDNGMAN